jgi:hypothetical protein
MEDYEALSNIHDSYGLIERYYILESWTCLEFRQRSITSAVTKSWAST